MSEDAVCKVMMLPAVLVNLHATRWELPPLQVSANAPDDPTATISESYSSKYAVDIVMQVAEELAEELDILHLKKLIFGWLEEIAAPALVDVKNSPAKLVNPCKVSVLPDMAIVG
jgi:hypothetical protein